jgi:hypothetical protein
MQLNLLKICPRAIDGVNKFTGTIPFGDERVQLPVIVERRLDGWDVEIRVCVNGCLMHQCNPNPKERADFDKMFEKAANCQTQDYEMKRSAGALAGKEAGLWEY